MQLVASLVCEGIDKKPLCSAIPFTEGRWDIDLREQAGGFARKLDWLDSARQVRAAQRVKYSCSNRCGGVNQVGGCPTRSAFPSIVVRNCPAQGKTYPLVNRFQMRGIKLPTTGVF
jgi:hypothetical protein